MRWDKPGIPQKGWIETGVIDLADETEPGADVKYIQCEMCGNERIRFVHILTHHQYPHELRVGCNCAEKLTDDYVNPKNIERTLRNRAIRKQNFLKQKWIRNSKGNYVLQYKQDCITIVPSKYGYGVFYKNNPVWKYKGESIRDLETAEIAAFDAFDEV